MLESLRHLRPSYGTDALLVAVLGGTAIYEIWVEPIFDDGIPGPRPLNTILMLGIILPLAWRRRLPIWVLGTVFTFAGTQMWFIDAAVSPQPPFQHWLAILIAMFSVGAHSDRRGATVAGLVGWLAFLAVDLAMMSNGTYRFDEQFGAWVLIAAAWGLGYSLRGSRTQASHHAARAARLEAVREEETRLAVVDERSRIARDVHDIVAHSVSVMVVQAQAAQRVMVGEEPSAREALISIEETGRKALSEMRRLVGFLREGEHDGLAPQHGLGDLESLVDAMRNAGLDVEYEIHGDPRPLPAGLDLSAYRILQEALTNVLKHAGPVRTRVALAYEHDSLDLLVSDEGPGAGTVGPAGSDGDGRGLAGMRERVALFGGILEHGGGPDGGHHIRVHLPT